MAGALALLAAGADGATGRGAEADAAARVGGLGGEPVELVVDKTRPFYNTDGMLESNADAIVEAYGRLAEWGIPPEGIRLVLVTHSIPASMERLSAPGPGEAERGSAGDDAGRLPEPVQPAGLRTAAPGQAHLEPGMAADLSTEISYVEQHRRLIAVLLPVVAERLGLSGALDHDLVYCSRSGPPQARWLEPDINDHLEALVAGRLTDGARVSAPEGVVVAPIGFVADHMEVVFDLDTEAAQTAARLGLPYARAATAGTHPALIFSLVDVLAERAAAARGQEVRPASTTGVGPFHTVCPPQCCRPAVRPAGPAGSADDRAMRPTAKSLPSVSARQHTASDTALVDEGIPR